MEIKLKGTLGAAQWGSGDLGEVTCDLGSGRCITVSVPNGSLAGLKRLGGQPMTLTLSVRDPDPTLEAHTSETGWSGGDWGEGDEG